MYSVGFTKPALNFATNWQTPTPTFANLTPKVWCWICKTNTVIYYRVFFNSAFYDLALIQSFFGTFEIGRTFFHSIHRRIFKNAKTLLIGQILVWKNFPQSWPLCVLILWKNVLPISDIPKNDWIKAKS